MRFAAYLSLFTSFSTLICCALPSLLISLGFGAVVVGIVDVFPQLIVLTENKKWLFLIGGILLSLGSISFYKARNAPCPIDPEQAEVCKVVRKWSLIILILSWTMYLIGFIFAYILPFILGV